VPVQFLIVPGEKWWIASAVTILNSLWRKTEDWRQQALLHVIILLMEFPAEAQKRISHCSLRDQIINLPPKPADIINPLDGLFVIR